jgi:uncharacterized protein YndB with AHSA1/START domain
MKGRNNPSEKKPGFGLVVTRIIHAPCALVFRAWTDPEHMAEWFSPADVECRGFTADVKIGGAYRVHMVSKNGDHVAIGKYMEIRPNERLQFTWEREDKAALTTMVTIDFEDLGKTTRLTLTHEGFPDQEDADDHNKGWSSMIEKFGRLLEQGKIKTPQKNDCKI